MGALAHSTFLFEGFQREQTLNVGLHRAGFCRCINTTRCTVSLESI